VKLTSHLNVLPRFRVCVELCLQVMLIYSNIAIYASIIGCLNEVPKANE